MITTSEGDIYVAGLALTDQTTKKSPEIDGLVFWVQRLDPDSGASLWWHMRYLFDGFSNYDVVYWLFLNDTLGQVLLQANDWNKSSGNCFWSAITPDKGEAVATEPGSTSTTTPASSSKAACRTSMPTLWAEWS